MPDGSRIQLRVTKSEGVEEVELNWLGFLSDWKEQDSRTSYGNLYKYIKILKGRGLLKTDKSILYLRSDGCAAQVSL